MFRPLTIQTYVCVFTLHARGGPGRELTDRGHVRALRLGLEPAGGHSGDGAGAQDRAEEARAHVPARHGGDCGGADAAAGGEETSGNHL